MSRVQSIAAGILVLAVVGCASGAPRSGAPEAAAPAPSGTAAGSSMALLSLRAENTPEPRIIVETSGRPVYTGYHPQPDVYVIDLLKTVRQANVVLPTNLPSFIASVAADEVLELGKPLTRVTVRFREPVSAFASAEGNGVVIGFEGVPSSIAASVPEPSAMVFEPADDVTVETVADVITPTSAPTPAPAEIRPSVPEARNPATRLDRIKTTGRGDSLAIALEGDGKFDYKDFKLTNPLRLVVDLKGTTNRVKGSTLELGDPYVRQVRVAQFKSSPDPVTRVVVDLDEYVGYHVRREGSRLVISFGDGPATSAPMVASYEPVATPQPRPSEPASTIAEIDAIPAAVPIPPARETAVIRGPQTAARTQPVLTQAPNVVTPAPARTIIDAGQENVFAADQGPTMTGGNIGEGRTISPPGRAYTGDPISLELTSADIKDVLRTFAELTGLNIAIDPNVAGQVTVSFDQVPWDQALELILRQNGLTYTISGNVMRVGTVDRLAAEQAQNRRLEEEARLNVPLTTVIKRLSYAKSDDVATLVAGLASPRGKIIVDARTNQLIITDVPEYLPTMLNLIENVDIPTPQVMIEARIVETTKTFARQLGISWGFSGSADPALGSGTGLVFPNRIDFVGGPFNFGAGNPVLELSLGSVLGTFDLDLTLTAAENEGLARIISAPKVTTQDNSPAQIESGLQIPFQTRVNFTTTVSFIQATLRLTVTPQITAEDTVIMDIELQKVEPIAGLDVAGATNPPLSTRRAQTRLMVRDGGTTVIGGIYTATENDAENRMPFIHEIPVIGNLFKSRRIENRNDELLIFITPRIVRNI
ncbi:MAG TPA: type IV pilus secretin PilQ [Thermoanaerobaculia bacterium]|nr:type IV pilus secretin PilQ [Thermoanaerobaculia bacterium]